MLAISLLLSVFRCSLLFTASRIFQVNNLYMTFNSGPIEYWRLYVCLGLTCRYFASRSLSPSKKIKNEEKKC